MAMNYWNQYSWLGGSSKATSLFNLTMAFLTKFKLQSFNIEVIPTLRTEKVPAILYTNDIMILVTS